MSLQSGFNSRRHDTLGGRQAMRGTSWSSASPSTLRLSRRSVPMRYRCSLPCLLTRPHATAGVVAEPVAHAPSLQGRRPPHRCWHGGLLPTDLHWGKASFWSVPPPVCSLALLLLLHGSRSTSHTIVFLVSSVLLHSVCWGLLGGGWTPSQSELK
jgi:hypothetical protein